MNFDNNLAAVHAYLCADGYVIKNPPTQQHKYYHIGFRNTNLVLLCDFQKKFNNYFGVKPILIPGERCRKQSKELFLKLTREYSYYSYEWKMPLLTEEKLKYWLRAFFDCEAWVECQKRKSRLIGLECVNEKGINQIKLALLSLGINSTIQKRRTRKIFRLCICGLDNLEKFKRKIGFLHPKKRKALNNALNSYTTIYRGKR